MLSESVDLRTAGRQTGAVPGHPNEARRIYKGMRIKKHYSGYEFAVMRLPKKKRRYVQLHVLIAREALGKDLPPGAVVHHIDGNKANNANDNLVILQNTAEHAALHVRMRKRDVERGIFAKIRAKRAAIQLLIGEAIP